jgi:hypothetical protein
MTLFPIEVKKTAQASEAYTKHFGALNKLGKKIGTGAVLCLGQSRIPINREIVSIPAWEI